jgi:4-hydroxy 2-oxovalerate aldolase
MTTQIMDCTLRDGSYQVNFSFTSAITTRVTRGLSNLGIPLIEVGHGAGIGAHKFLTPARETDLEYGLAAEKAKGSSKWGMFAIAGISTAEEISSMVDIGMGFVRVGIDIDSLATGRELLRKLQKCGVDVYVNFMKSYALPPSELVARAKSIAIENKLSGVYLVDSAGGMLPDEILQYGDEMQPLKEFAALGFHGHDNLGLAVSNSVALVHRGFTLIDATLQGLGRSSGNAATEKLVATLKRLGFLPGVDLAELLRLGEAEIRPMIPLAGRAGLDTMAGYTRFHTSHMEKLLGCARDFDVDPYELMAIMCEHDLTKFDTAFLHETARRMHLSGSRLTSPIPKDYYLGNEQDLV